MGVVRLRPYAVSALAWTVGVVVSVTVGLLALRLVGAGIDTDNAMQPLTSQTIGAGTTTPVDVLPSEESRMTQTPLGPSVAPTRGPDRWLTSSGGSVLARCDNGGAYLVSWSPAPGYRAEGIVRGPALMAQVQFEGTGWEIKLSVTCAGDVPQSTVHKEEAEDGPGHE